MEGRRKGREGDKGGQVREQTRRAVAEWVATQSMERIYDGDVGGKRRMESEEEEGREEGGKGGEGPGSHQGRTGEGGDVKGPGAARQELMGGKEWAHQEGRVRRARKRGSELEERGSERGRRERGRLEGGDWA